MNDGSVGDNLWIFQMPLLCALVRIKVRQDSNESNYESSWGRKRDGA